MASDDAGTIPSNPGADRDARGLFLPGNSIAKTGGRPKAIDFRALVQRERGKTLDQKILAVFDSLAEQAAKGDVGAAKLLLERLCGKDADEVRLVDDTPQMGDAEFARRVVSMLAVANARRVADAARN